MRIGDGKGHNVEWSGDPSSESPTEEAEPLELDWDVVMRASSGNTGTVPLSPFEPLPGDILSVPARSFPSGLRPRDKSTVIPLPSDAGDKTTEEVTRHWHSQLPRVTPEQARLSASFAALPARLAAQAGTAITKSLSLYAQTTAQDVSLRMIEAREVNGTLASHIASSPLLYLCLRVEPQAVPLTIALETDFAAALVDRVLGGQGARPEVLRELSPTEKAVIEFLSLKCVRELGAISDEPVVTLERITSEIPAWLAATEGRSSHSRCLQLSLRVGVSRSVSVARVWMGPEAVTSLQQAQRLAGFAHDSESSVKALAEKVARYARIAPEVRQSLIIGQSRLRIGDLEGLEADDVMLIGQPYVQFQNGKPRGRLCVRLGEGEHTLISGQATMEKGIALQVGAVTSGNKLTIREGLEMMEPETETGVGSFTATHVADDMIAEMGELIDGLLVTVHVELAARRVRLDDLSRLRIGQIMDLECQATDPVELTVDGRCIARGELVSFEGRLGVRITHI